MPLSEFVLCNSSINNGKLLKLMHYDLKIDKLHSEQSSLYEW